MSLVDVDSWLMENEACERLNHTILQQLSQREQRQKLSSEYNRITASIQVGLKQFETELQQLKDKLESSAKSRSINFEEIERRKHQVDTLQSHLMQLKRRNTNATRSDRAALLNEIPSSSSPWQTSKNAADDAPIIDTSDVETLKRRQIEILEDQNRGLDALSQTISRQRNLATQLGQEVEDQNDILENLADTMERVDTGVHVETGNIGLVNRTDSTWGYWIVIIVLFVAIVIIALL